MNQSTGDNLVCSAGILLGQVHVQKPVIINSTAVKI